MSRNSNKKSSPVAEEHPTVEAIIKLFWDSRGSPRNFLVALAVQMEIAKLATQVAISDPNTKAHGDAFLYHHYMLLWLAKMGSSKEERRYYLDRAYEVGANAVDILLKLEKHTDLHAVFSASNLAGDMIRSARRYKDGLHWMLESRALLLRLIGKKKMRKGILYYKWYTQEYFIARAMYELGDKEGARRIVKRILRQAPRLDKTDWDDLKGIAQTAQLFAEIQLDDLKTKQAAS